MALLLQRTTVLPRTRLLVVRADKFVRVPSTYKKADSDAATSGDDWYTRTRRAARGVSDPKYDDMMAERRKKVQRYVDREDLYTENWDGDRFKGSRWNVLTVLAALFLLTPIVGLVFAYFSYGSLWG